MKTKILLLILIIFMMCGCSASVNLEITEDKIKEKTDIIVYQNAIYPKEILKTTFRNYIPIYAKDVLLDEAPDKPFENIKYYEKEAEDLGDGYKFTYKYNFNIDDYNNARSIKEGFRNYNVNLNKNSKIITLFADSSNLLYFDNYRELEEIKINIKTDYLVKKHNADYIDNGTYTWILTRNNKKNIDMIIDISSNANKNINVNSFYIITIIISVLFISFAIFFRIKKNNKI